LREKSRHLGESRPNCHFVHEQGTAYGPSWWATNDLIDDTAYNIGRISRVRNKADYVGEHVELGGEMGNACND